MKDKLDATLTTGLGCTTTQTGMKKAKKDKALSLGTM